MEQTQDFAHKLRFWRTRRGLSQMELAGRADISQRHLSFLELGRASPSRDMVARLATTLNLPLRQQNALLVAAGFSPVWQQTDLTAPELAAVSTAIDFMLSAQEPFPAVALDRHWNVVRANNAAVRLIEFLVGPVEPGAVINLADALVAPGPLRPLLVNWADVVRHFIRGIEADAAADGHPESAKLLLRLLAYDDVLAVMRNAPAEEARSPVLPMHFRKDGTTLSLFTTIATLGTPQDITLQELRIESFFPWDDQTAQTLRAWASLPAG